MTLRRPGIGRRALLRGAGAAAAAPLAACGPDGSAPADAEAAGATGPPVKKIELSVPDRPEKGTLTIGMQPWLGYAPWYLAEAKKYARDYDLTIKLLPLADDKALLKAVSDNAVDVINMSAHNALRLREAGVDGRVVWIEDLSEKADAIVAPQVSDVDGLAGKRVALEKGATSDLLLRAALGAHDLTLGGTGSAAVKPVYVPAAEVGKAISQGRADAGVTYEPYVSALVADSDTAVMYTADRLQVPGLIADVMVALPRGGLRKPGQLSAALHVWDAAVREYMAKPQDSIAIMAEALGYPAEQVAPAFEGLSFYHGVDNTAGRLERFARESMPPIAETARDAGIIKNRYSEAQLLSIVVDGIGASYAPG